MKNNQQVDIPLVFIFLASVIVILGVFFKTAFQKPVIDTERVHISPTVVNKKNTSPLIDYNKPISCNYKTKESSMSAAMDKNSIYATIQNSKSIQRYVVEGDCMYSWNSGEFIGTKKCGIGSSVVIGKQVLSSGLGSIDSITSMLPKTEKTSGMDFQAVFESCKNVREVNGGMFVVPKSVVFK